VSDKAAVDLSGLRKPFTGTKVGKLPRVTCPHCSDKRKQCGEHDRIWCDVCKSKVSQKHIHIDYVGHGDTTIRLLDVDEQWSWEPMARDIDPAVLTAAAASGNPEVIQMMLKNAPPKFDLDAEGNPVGLWINLTIGGVTRPGYGSVPSSQDDAVKVLIGDALRNAAMRFGVALDLWAKGDRADPTRENATASAGQASRRGSGQSAADAFENARPRPSNQGPGREITNGSSQQRGQVSRPAQPTKTAAADPDEIDTDAQVYADEAHQALTVRDVEDIHKRAREAGKVAALVRNPAGGGVGKLAVYLDWRRKQLKELDDALAALTTAAKETGFPVNDIEAHVKSVTGTDLDAANVTQIRHATQALRSAQGTAA